MHNVSRVISELVKAANAREVVSKALARELLGRSLDEMVALRAMVKEREFQPEIDTMTQSLLAVAKLGAAAEDEEDRRAAILTTAQMLIRTRIILKEYLDRL
jgi:maltooligosyltrehalose synthase